MNERMYKAIIILPIIAILFGALPSAYGQNNNQTITNETQPGYNDGYNDAIHHISPADQCLGHPQDWCNGYNAGFYLGNGNSSVYYAPAFRGKDFGDLSDIPIIGGLLGQPITTGILHSEQGVFVPWSFICHNGQRYLLQSCNTLVDSNGNLTPQGDRAIGCIRNGLGVALEAQKHNLGGLAQPFLNFAAPLTGCSGIVNLDTIKNAPDFQNILNYMATLAP